MSPIVRTITCPKLKISNAHDDPYLNQRQQVSVYQRSVVCRVFLTVTTCYQRNLYSNREREREGVPCDRLTFTIWTDKSQESKSITCVQYKCLKCFFFNITLHVSYASYVTQSYKLWSHFENSYATLYWLDDRWSFTATLTIKSNDCTAIYQGIVSALFIIRYTIWIIHNFRWFMNGDCLRGNDWLHMESRLQLYTQKCMYQ